MIMRGAAGADRPSIPFSPVHASVLSGPFREATCA